MITTPSHSIIRPLASLVLTLALWSNPIQAQEKERPTVQPTPEQQALNARGLKAHKAGDYLKASELFRAGLAVGPLNLLYLNLGRALQKAGECQPAHDALKQVFATPNVSGLSLDQVENTARRYIAELEETCPGTLLVRCEPTDLILTIDDQTAACGERVEIEPGPHTVAGELLGVRGEQQVEIESLEQATITMTISAPTSNPPPKTNLAEAEQDQGALTIAGWALLGTGGALVASGLVFSLLTNRANDDLDGLADDAGQGTLTQNDASDTLDRAERYQRLQFVGYGLGAAALLTGATLMIVDGHHSPEAKPAVWEVHPVTTSDAGGVVVRWSY